MKFNLLILFIFYISCAPHNTKLDNRNLYNSTGFAYIYNEDDYKNKKIKKKLNNELLQISHKGLKIGTLIKLINPQTKESILLKNSKKIDYPDYYKILVTEPVAKKLNINYELPMIEVLEVKKNKSFVAKKAKIYQEEKKISSNAPVTSVKIANISKKKITKTNKKKNIYIFVASFYTSEAATLLKTRIVSETPSYDIKKLIIRKKTTKEFEVLSGP